MDPVSKSFDEREAYLTEERRLADSSDEDGKKEEEEEEEEEEVLGRRERKIFGSGLRKDYGSGTQYGSGAGEYGSLSQQPEGIAVPGQERKSTASGSLASTLTESFASFRDLGSAVGQSTKEAFVGQTMIAGYYDSKAFSNSQRNKLKKRQKRIAEKKQREAAGAYGRYSLDAARYPPVSGMVGEPFMKPKAQQMPADDESPLVGEGDDEDVKLMKKGRTKSSFAQSLFNAVNVLMGIGLLGFPYAMRVSGLIPGLIISTMCALITNYTAKLLGHCLDARPGLNTYSDMGDAAFGAKGRYFISIIFFFELIVGCIALLILAGDTLSSLFNISPVILKFGVFLIVLPMTYLKNLSMLAFGSFFGITATTLLILFLILVGAGVFEGIPGSGNLDHPDNVQMIADPVLALPLSFGLIMSGYAGHSVFPSIYREMAEPEKYGLMVDLSYITVGVAYTVTMVVGYLMYGLDVENEVQLNLAEGDPGALVTAILWLIVIIPLTKYALIANPVNLTVENLVMGDTSSYDLSCKQNVLRIVIRTAVSFLVLFIAIVYSEFDSVMALLGAFFSFTVSVLFPVACALKLYSNDEQEVEQHTPVSSSVQHTKEVPPSLPESANGEGWRPSSFSFTPTTRLLNQILFFISLIMASSGTVWAFLIGMGVWDVPSSPTVSPTPSFPYFMFPSPSPSPSPLGF